LSLTHSRIHLFKVDLLYSSYEDAREIYSKTLEK
jgi:hypothetical protein